MLIFLHLNQALMYNSYSIPNTDQKGLKQARLSNQNSFTVTPPKNFTIQLLYNEKTGKMSCDELEEKRWINPCDIYTYGSGSVYQMSHCEYILRFYFSSEMRHNDSFLV